MSKQPSKGGPKKPNNPPLDVQVTDLEHVGTGIRKIGEKNKERDVFVLDVTQKGIDIPESSRKWVSGSDELLTGELAGAYFKDKTDIFFLSHGWKSLTGPGSWGKWDADQKTNPQSPLCVGGQYDELVKFLQAEKQPGSKPAFVCINWPSDDPNAPKDFMKGMVSFWPMRERAIKVGAHVGTVMTKLVKYITTLNGKQPKVHMVGHSFGCIVVTSATVEYGKTGSEVQSVTLLQAAMSSKAFTNFDEPAADADAVDADAADSVLPSASDVPDTKQPDVPDTKQPFGSFYSVSMPLSKEEKADADAAIKAADAATEDSDSEAEAAASTTAGPSKTFKGGSQRGFLSDFADGFSLVGTLIQMKQQADKRALLDSTRGRFWQAPQYVRGAFLVTSSSKDVAVNCHYYLADALGSMLRKPNEGMGHLGGMYDDDHLALGNAGVDQVDSKPKALYDVHEKNKTYKFQPGTLFNLECTRLIQNHSDIFNAPTAKLVWQAASYEPNTAKRQKLCKVDAKRMFELAARNCRVSLLVRPLGQQQKLFCSHF
ncbi:hypothetical protein JKP88DRAFT_247987 [Tribonema minus]|uniref:Uncharacterized protein n=1 Tax=Tribonema minus TaxID=303371 RepID=A0A836CA39_9STRA|nr:hypothetical protein JKP88DRAFT_247987 [Tribonema minus]